MYNMTAAHAAAINNRLIKLAVDAELNASAAIVVLDWLSLAQRWAERHARPALRESCRKMAVRIKSVPCEACGCLTDKATALTARHGEEIFLCSECQITGIKGASNV